MPGPPRRAPSARNESAMLRILGNWWNRFMIWLGLRHPLTLTKREFSKRYIQPAMRHWVEENQDEGDFV